MRGRKRVTKAASRGRPIAGKKKPSGLGGPPGTVAWYGNTPIDADGLPIQGYTPPPQQQPPSLGRPPAGAPGGAFDHARPPGPGPAPGGRGRPGQSNSTTRPRSGGGMAQGRTIRPPKKRSRPTTG